MSSANPSRKSGAFPAIFWGGLLCGVLDISSAIVAYGMRGVRPIRIFQSVASGWMGAAAFRGGMATAALGALFHFKIAFVAAAVFYLASRKISFLTAHPVWSGLLYGECVFVFMHFVVVPLSHVQSGPYSWALLATGPLGHPFLVGLPIALATKRFAPRQRAILFS
ncbi:MAG: hypothetical protein ACRD5L_06805 [Bryobacteraceae bacterium]